MTKNIHGYLINPFVLLDPATGRVTPERLKESLDPYVTRVTLPDTLEGIRASLNVGLPSPCQTVPTRWIEGYGIAGLPGHIVYGNEEGRLHEVPKAWSVIQGFSEPIAHRSILFGTDGEGNDISPETNIVEFAHTVRIGAEDWDCSFDPEDVSRMVIRHFQGVHVLDAWAQERRIVTQRGRDKMGMYTFGDWYDRQKYGRPIQKLLTMKRGLSIMGVSEKERIPSWHRKSSSPRSARSCTRTPRPTRRAFSSTVTRWT